MWAVKLQLHMCAGHDRGPVWGDLWRSSSVVNWFAASWRALHRSHLSDSFPFVILRIQTLVGKVCEVACRILLWSGDLTEVIFIHSPNNFLPSPSRRNQSAEYVDVIGPFWWSMNEPSSLILSLFLDSWHPLSRDVLSRHLSLSSSSSRPSSEMSPFPFRGMCSLRHLSAHFSYAR